ncbi:endonuclease MutS2 [Trichloromonas sp.]|uniref:endonuclease MutS2 n=1 Tax=Trichloromonas sp. TaxID=3069249 RepID=UPI003D81925F
MIEATLRVLEYDKVTALLAGFTASAPGKERAQALAPLADRHEVAEALAEVSEVVALLAGQGRPPVGGCRDLRDALGRLRAEGTFLLPEVLLDVLSSIEAARDCRNYFAGREQAPRLAERSAALEPLRELQREIRQSIGARGELLDSASFELGDLRQQVRQLRSRIKRSLEDLLGSERLAGAFQERLITERNGRYVVPVRADHRGKVKGFIHDESASGQTLFVEPVSVLEWNNQLQSLQREEKREEERILRRLSSLVRRESSALQRNQEILAHLDLRAAAGHLSRGCDAVAPRLAETPLLELREARHPLLLFHPDGSRRQQPVTAVDLLLGEDADTLVISGPNTGGKTVALKTIGLLALMVRSGLHIPCHPDSRIGLFGQVFADIGDEQSIEENLSTFSGHLRRIGRILEEADGDSLVLMDEVGTGTDPAEGGALAMAVLDSLRRRGARTVVTTHLNLVKGYAHMQQGVENAAVEFDRTTLAPTYRLHYGIPGASNAFTIARRLGIAEEVLERAAGYLGQGEREGLELLEELNRLRKDLDRDLVDAASLKRRAEQERQKRRLLLQELEEQKRSILDKATRRGEQLVREAEQRLKTVLKEARDEQVDARDQARLSAELRGVREDLSRQRPEPLRKGKSPAEVQIGELLRVPALNSEAEVIRLCGDEVELSIQGKKLRLPLAQLEAFVPRRFAKRGTVGQVRSRIERQGFTPKLMLVGKRAEDALLLLDRFVDDALLHHQRQVEVVHGAGEGILRRTVRDFLAAHREVKAFHAADLAQGGDNVTIIELREG